MEQGLNKIIIVVDSLTGLSQKFADKLPYYSCPVKEFNETIENLRENKQYLFLITRCHKFGEIPPTTLAFLDKYSSLVIGVACSGNRNWGQNFGVAGDKIEDLYKIPHIVKFEAMGFSNDREKVKIFIDDFLKKNF